MNKDRVTCQISAVGRMPYYYLSVSTNRVPVSAIRRMRDNIKTEFTEVGLSLK